MRLGQILSLLTVAATVGVVLWLAFRQWMTGVAPDEPPMLLISLVPAGSAPASGGIDGRKIRVAFRCAGA